MQDNSENILERNPKDKKGVSENLGAQNQVKQTEQLDLEENGNPKKRQRLEEHQPDD